MARIMLRLCSLILGPAFIVGLAYLVARPSGLGSPMPLEGAGTAGAAAAASESRHASARPSSTNAAHPELVAACQKRREALMQRLGSQFSSIVHTPFVIVGDLSTADLERHYQETIAPTAAALSIAYFDRPAAEPIAIVLLSGDEAYQACADRLDGQRRASFAGYYQRGDRRMVVNLSTGAGTIAHELTHALAHFDFPDMPEWFDEGLASLHEEGRFSDDRLRIAGARNWRSRYLLPALQQRTLQPLESLIGQARVRHEQQAIDYAHARYFCLFLQDRGLLEPFYRKFRLGVSGDPTGLRTLRALFRVNDLSPVDEEFRAWVLAVERPNGSANGKGAGTSVVRDGRLRTRRDSPAPAENP